MKKLRLILVMLVAFACVKCDSKKKNSENDSESSDISEIEIKQSAKLDFTVTENLLENSNLFNITYDSHEFSEGISFSEVNILETEKDTYSIILVLDENKTDMEELQKWKIGMLIYPVNPEEFENKQDQEKGKRSLGIKIKPLLMGDEVVILHENLKLKPKSFEYIRFYLYNNDGQASADYYKIKDIDFK